MEHRLKHFLKNLKANESTISMFLGGLVMLVIAVLIFNYYRSTPRQRITDESSATEAGILANEIEDIQNLGVQSADGDIDLEYDEDKEIVKTPKVQKILKQGEHEVAQGEHLWSIAEKYYGSGYNWVDIAKQNDIPAPYLVEIGQVLAVPDVEPKQPTRIASKIDEEATATTIASNNYTVQRGDNLWSISVRAYSDGYKWMDIWKANRSKILDADKIEIGQVLIIPR